MNAEAVKKGQKYGRLTVVDLIPDRKNPLALCLCECGKKCTPQRGALKNGRAKSCGCLRAENVGKRTHGMSKSRAYYIWAHILRRCNDASFRQYGDYGGRGIRCLYSSFDEFNKDVGDPPEGAWIDRVDNEGNYEPGNCRWVTPSENLKNTRRSKWWAIDGVVYESAPEAAKAIGVHPSVVIRNCNGYWRRGRYHPPRKGWSSTLKYPGSACEAGVL